MIRILQLMPAKAMEKASARHPGESLSAQLMLLQGLGFRVLGYTIGFRVTRLSPYNGEASGKENGK